MFSVREDGEKIFLTFPDGVEDLIEDPLQISKLTLIIQEGSFVVRKNPFKLVEWNRDIISWNDEVHRMDESFIQSMKLWRSIIEKRGVECVSDGPDDSLFKLSLRTHDLSKYKLEDPSTRIRHLFFNGRHNSLYYPDMKPQRLLPYPLIPGLNITLIGKNQQSSENNQE